MTIETFSNAGTVQANVNNSTVTDSSAFNSIEVGYDFNLSHDINSFRQSLADAADRVAPEHEIVNSRALYESVSAIASPFAHIDNEATALAKVANQLVLSDRDMSPSEIVMLTARSQEFMFHSQLTANITNRAADGLQQLFRQQG